MVKIGFSAGLSDSVPENFSDKIGGSKSVRWFAAGFTDSGSSAIFRTISEIVS
jgi:hypothetical protein